MIAISAITFTSCSSLDSDAQKVADINCKMQKLSTKALAGDASATSEVQKLSMEVLTIAEKYKEEDKKKLEDAAILKMGGCNGDSKESGKDNSSNETPTSAPDAPAPPAPPAPPMPKN